MNLNPMGLTAVTSVPYVQPNTANPAPNPQIASYATGRNPLAIVGPQSVHVEAGTSQYLVTGGAGQVPSPGMIRPNSTTV